MFIEMELTDLTRAVSLRLRTGLRAGGKPPAGEYIWPTIHCQDGTYLYRNEATRRQRCVTWEEQQCLGGNQEFC